MNRFRLAVATTAVFSLMALAACIIGPKQDDPESSLAIPPGGVSDSASPDTSVIRGDAGADSSVPAPVLDADSKLEGGSDARTDENEAGDAGPDGSDGSTTDGVSSDGIAIDSLGSDISSSDSTKFDLGADR